MAAPPKNNLASFLNAGTATSKDKYSRAALKSTSSFTFAQSSKPVVPAKRASPNQVKQPAFKKQHIEKQPPLVSKSNNIASTSNAVPKKVAQATTSQYFKKEEPEAIVLDDDSQPKEEPADQLPPQPIIAHPKPARRQNTAPPQPDLMQLINQQQDEEPGIEELQLKVICLEKDIKRINEQILQFFDEGRCSSGATSEQLKELKSAKNAELEHVQLQIANLEASANLPFAPRPPYLRSDERSSSESPLIARGQTKQQLAIPQAAQSRMSTPAAQTRQPVARPQPKPRSTPEIPDADDDDDIQLMNQPSRAPPPALKPVAKPLQPPKPLVQAQLSIASNANAASKSTSGRAASAPPQHKAQPVVPLPKKAAVEYPWSRDVRKALTQIFRLKDFRPNQLDAINATLGGKDAFVLMPTGGGKSMCYQLPAIIQSGSTKGVTIVVSPLLSLIQDQCQSLFDKGIPVVTINSTQDQNLRKFNFAQITSREPTAALVYITPEMIGKSAQFQNALRILDQNKRLARFVIDEAHCVSQWGHDLRPDYKDLSRLKREFPHIPLMALTATANERVKQDIIHVLGMKEASVFSQSFNRPNLYYEVRPKSKNMLSQIADFINNEHEGECGIIYCLSKRACEDTAKRLREDFQIQASHYHAGMTKDDREKTQRGWQSGQFDVICATIAFGMGIDKPDVRFVVHANLPSSLEGYYQETGRAGRDGNNSICILYYSYADCHTLDRFIDDSNGTAEQKESQRSNLRRVVQFCMNQTDCRRTQVLHYFAETFDKANCHKTCDNCQSAVSTETRDVTDLTKDVIGLVGNLAHDKITVTHCIDIFRGSKAKAIMDKGRDSEPAFGKGSHLDRGTVERLFHHLLIEQVLVEKCQTNAAGFTSAYLQLGRNATTVSSNRKKISMSFAVGKGKAAPISRQPSKSYALDDYGSEEEDEVVPVMISNKAKQASKKADKANDDPVQICFAELMTVRDDIASDQNVAAQAVASDEFLELIATLLPTSTAEFSQLDGFDDDTFDLYFRAFREITRRYKNAPVVAASQAMERSSAPTKGKKRSAPSGSNAPPAKIKSKPFLGPDAMNSVMKNCSFGGSGSTSKSKSGSKGAGAKTTTKKIGLPAMVIPK